MQAGWHDFDPTSIVPHTAIFEMEIMEEVKTIQVAQMYDQEQNPMNGRVYDVDGIAPTLRTPMGGLSEPKIMQIGSYSPSSACNAKVLDVDGICPTVMENHGSVTTVAEPNGIYDNQFGDFAREPIHGLARTIKADNHNAVLYNFHIRKLTPRECFRLMDVDDADIDKIDAYRIKTTLKDGTVKEKPIPKSQKYKLAGNSIVVSCLYHIFKGMFIDEKPKLPPKQLDLFDDLWQEN